jgi:hypothetical protein
MSNQNKENYLNEVKESLQNEIEKLKSELNNKNRFVLHNIHIRC